MYERIREQTIRVYDTKTKEISFHKVIVEEGRLNGHIAWSLYFAKSNEETLEVRDRYFLSDALNYIRENLEGENKLIVVRGADRDCASSGMQADMTAGSSVSKLEMTDRLNRGEKINMQDYMFGVLEDSRIECVTTIQKQEKYYANWLAGNLPKRNKGMKTVWKFELKMETLQEISMPLQSKILSVGVIQNIGYLWAEVSEPMDETQKVKILTVPTGAEFQGNTEFIGTLMYKEGELVQHIFKVI
ncbi:MAG: hypothetical protein EAZ08_03245 [Cytophagales bacterium]|nr:MAG: hypothetical protein EAZ08_03245 [Cytophagales bacterium]